MSYEIEINQKIAYQKDKYKSKLKNAESEIRKLFREKIVIEGKMYQLRDENKRLKVKNSEIMEYM